MQRLLGGDDVVPGMITGIQTLGGLLHFRPHIYAPTTWIILTPNGVIHRSLLASVLQGSPELGASPHSVTFFFRLGCWKVKSAT